MNMCGQEMCPYWGGDGCVCDVLAIDQEERDRAREALERQLDQ